MKSYEWAFTRKLHFSMFLIDSISAYRIYSRISRPFVWAILKCTNKHIMKLENEVGTNARKNSSIFLQIFVTYIIKKL
jgi:hypothetical protein